MAILACANVPHKARGAAHTSCYYTDEETETAQTAFPASGFSPWQRWVLTPEAHTASCYLRSPAEHLASRPCNPTKMCLSSGISQEYILGIVHGRLSEGPHHMLLGRLSRSGLKVAVTRHLRKEDPLSSKDPELSVSPDPASSAKTVVRASRILIHTEGAFKGHLPESKCHRIKPCHSCEHV